MKSKARLTGRVIFRGDPGYERARKNWDPHTNRFPKVFVFAQRTQDVANAIRWARENRVPIRARSGRHALETNLSQVNGGIVIDVSNMKNIWLDKKGNCDRRDGQHRGKNREGPRTARIYGTLW